MTRLATTGNAERAAVILMLMDDTEAAKLLACLDPDELQRVGEQMIALGDIDPARMSDAIAGFVNLADSTTLSARNRPGLVRERMTQALGEVKADSIMQRIEPDAPPPSLEIARWLSPAVLLPLVEKEHPQVIAVLLLVLDAEPAAELLSILPARVQPDIVERIARMQSVSGHAMEMLEELLTERISKRFGKSALALGGAREAAELINKSARSVNGTVMPAITEKDAELARAIEAEMFTFEMLYALEPMEMGRLLRDVDNEVLVNALKGLEQDDREPFFAAMSSRAADGVKDEIEERGRLKKSDVVAAQDAIVKIARGLADEGEISLGGDDGEFV